MKKASGLAKGILSSERTFPTIDQNKNMNKHLLLVGLLSVTFCTLAHPGVGIVMDSKGNVYYTDLAQVWKIEPSGKKTSVVKNVHTHELYLDTNDNLFGEHLWYEGEKTDKWGYYVWELTSTGALKKIIPNTEGFLTNYSFVRDKLGRMYWAKRDSPCQKITRKNGDGTLTVLGDSCMGNVRWITCTPDGVVYAVDLHDLKRIDPNGHVATIAVNLTDPKFSQLLVNEQHYLSGVTYDDSKNVYISDFSGREVKKVTPDGAVSIAARTKIPWSPAATLLSPNGDFWMLEYSITNDVRVEKITTDGKRVVF
jgi:hypothetical protein